MRLLLASMLLAVVLPGGAVASSNTAHVAFASTSPVSVRGTGFKSGERVAVTVSSRVTKKKMATATSRGAFRTTFTGFSIARCQAYAVQAKGDRGSVAFAKLIPECAQPRPGDAEPMYPLDPPKKP